MSNMSGNDKDEVDKWRWGLQLHLEGVFNNRSHFFLLSQSMFMVAFVTAAGGKWPDHLLICTTAILGISFSLAWIYMGWNTYSSLRWLIERNYEEIEEYRKYLNKNSAEECKNHNFSNVNRIMALGLPIAFIVAWVILLFCKW